jgi:lysophospholipase L1-like esterase
MMKKILIISIVTNFLFFLLGAYVIHKRGGVDYIRQKLNLIFNQTEESRGHYYNVKNTIFEVMPNNTNEIIFLGDSITDYSEWHELFGNSTIKNRGISGDTINGVINRLNEVTSSKPDKLFVMIGINDLGRGRSVNQILIDYELLIKTIVDKIPDTELYIQSILPTDDHQSRQNIDIIKINSGLVEITEKYNLTYVNLFDLFITTENRLNPELTLDGLHINGRGYLVWKDAIIDYVNK